MAAVTLRLLLCDSFKCLGMYVNWKIRPPFQFKTLRTTAYLNVVLIPYNCLLSRLKKED
jgi:hypothetical protein